VQKELDRANLRVIALEKEMIGLRASSASRGRGRDEQQEVERLRLEVAEQREVIDALRAGRTGGGGASRWVAAGR
jgi:hypothetical protein